MLGDCLHRPSRNFTNYITQRRRGSENMTVDRHFRLTDEEATRLGILSNKTGYTVNAIIRMLIDNVDSVTMSKLRTLTRHDDLILSNAKYNAMLRKNIATNINELAKYVNGSNVNNDALENAFYEMCNRVDHLQEEMDKRYASFKDNK